MICLGSDDFPNQKVFWFGKLLYVGNCRFVRSDNGKDR